MTASNRDQLESKKLSPIFAEVKMDLQQSESLASEEKFINATIGYSYLSNNWDFIECWSVNLDVSPGGLFKWTGFANRFVTATIIKQSLFVTPTVIVKILGIMKLC
jgi:hypothetical protein